MRLSMERLIMAASKAFLAFLFVLIGGLLFLAYRFPQQVFQIELGVNFSAIFTLISNNQDVALKYVLQNTAVFFVAVFTAIYAFMVNYPWAEKSSANISESDPK